MLRTFRRSDAVGFSKLIERHFPEENRLLGMRPVEFEKIIERTSRWDFHFILGLLRVFGKRIVDLFVVEVDGQVAATALLFYLRNAGYIGMVMVDDPYRRRGYAVRVVTACIEHARRAGRPYAMLDVLTANDPARQLYAKLGFRELETGTFYVRESGTPGASPPAAADAAEIRPFHRRDAAALVRIAAAELTPQVATVTPAEPGDFTSAPMAARALMSETEAWVVGPAGQPLGFVRGTVAPAMEAANLTHPILDPALSVESGRRLIDHAVAWAAAKGAPRVVTELKGATPRAEAALLAAGFRPSIQMLTLYRPTAE